MNTDTYTSLLVPAEPRLLRIIGPHSEVTDRLLHLQQRSPGLAVRFLRGKKMATVQSMFDEFAAALQFPYYFGSNWAAFDECLADLAWLPATAYVLTIWDSAALLAKESTEYEILFGILERVCVEWSTPIAVGESWDRPAVPFHVVFHSNLENSWDLPSRIAAVPSIL